MGWTRDAMLTFRVRPFPFSTLRTRYFTTLTKPVKTPKVAVALSGGIDSATAAYLGYDVFGIHMRNWSEIEENGVCTGDQEQLDVEAICQHLSIPLTTISFEKEYWNFVFEPMIKEYASGASTPNPDVVCNKEIKFKCLLQKAQELGADLLATGHYARIRYNLEKEKFELLRAVDLKKDQTFFLSQLKEDVFPHILFPIGYFIKWDVRQLAKKINLPNANKKESMGICFVGKRKFSSFLSQYVQPSPGDFIDMDGNKVGEHNGLPFYTIGQGASIGGTNVRYFVASKSVKDNTIRVCVGAKNPVLYSSSLLADITWVGDPPAIILRDNGTLDCSVKIRHPSDTSLCQLSLVLQTENGAYRCRITFEEAVRAVSPGQMLALYDEPVCLGGGIIVES